MAQKTYASAPLPFVGQKRNFINHFKKVLNEHIDSDGEGWTIVDVFGGSGLLAHNAKRLLPKARVILMILTIIISSLSILMILSA